MAKQKRAKRFPAEHYLPEVQAYITAKGPSTGNSIATVLGLSQSGAYAMLKRLVERGYLRSERGGGPTSSLRYAINLIGKADDTVEPYVVTTAPKAARKVRDSFDKDRRIALAAETLFDMTKIDMLSLLQWVQLTKELM